MSQAPGLSGTPDSGHCWSAASSASWARSSARLTSRSTRVRPAMSLADSMRHTASIARSVSEAATLPDESRRPRATQPRSALRRLVQLLDARAQLLVLGSKLRRERRSEIVGLEDRPDLDLGVPGVRIRAAPHPLDRLGHRS